eukprot:scaffold296889_cov26-Tisochrysis_lutea.AAC.1
MPRCGLNEAQGLYEPGPGELVSRNGGKRSALEKPHVGALRPRMCGCFPIEEKALLMLAGPGDMSGDDTRCMCEMKTCERVRYDGLETPEWR